MGTEERGLKAKLEMETTWTVDESRRQFAVKVDRIRFTSSGNVGIGPFEVVYDSADKTTSGHGAKALGAHFDVVVESSSQVKLDASGTVTALELPKDVRDRFSEEAAAELIGFFGETVSMLGLKRAMFLVGVPLPDKEVSPVDTWKHQYTLRVDQGRLKDVSGIATYFLSDADSNGSIATIRMESEEKLNIEGETGAKSQMNGTIHFDRSNGSLLKGTWTRKSGTFSQITTSVERTALKQ